MRIIPVDLVLFGLARTPTFNQELLAPLIVQRYTRELVSYWLCRPAALELRRSQDWRNAVCLRRAEGQDLVPYRDGR
jgi:hypothetical protein